MSALSRPLTWGAAVVCGVVLTASADGQTTTNKGVRPAAQAKRYGRVHQMEILDGSRRTVRYFGDNISPGESSTLRELERAENEMAYLNELQALKTQYVVSERLLEPHRQLVQRQLYGVDKTTTSYGTVAAGYYGYSPSGSWGFPSRGFGFGWGTNAGLTAMGGDSTTQTLSVANGVGPTGPIKEAMAMVLSQQATPEYAAKIDRNYDMAVLRATASPSIQTALRMPTTEEAQKEDGVYRRLSGEAVPAGMVLLTLKDGEKVQAKKLTEKGEWFVIEKADGGQERIRQSEVTRIQGSGSGVVPAAGS